MTPIAIVIVNYNTREHLRACLATVQMEEPTEVVVVDNVSLDGSGEMVKGEYLWVTLHVNRKNLGTVRRQTRQLRVATLRMCCS